jgi:hypothetical protein
VQIYDDRDAPPNHPPPIPRPGRVLINPPQAVLDNVKSWPTLSDLQTEEFNKLYADVTGG